MVSCVVTSVVFAGSACSRQLNSLLFVTMASAAGRPSTSQRRATHLGATHTATAFSNSLVAVQLGVASERPRGRAGRRLVHITHEAVFGIKTTLLA